MEQPQQQHREYQWQVEEEADVANLQPRQSRRHRLNNHAATTDIISPSTGNGSSNNSSITDDAGSSIQSMTASRAGSATPSLKKKKELLTITASVRKLIMNMITQQRPKRVQSFMELGKMGSLPSWTTAFTLTMAKVFTPSFQIEATICLLVSQSFYFGIC